MSPCPTPAKVAYRSAAKAKKEIRTWMCGKYKMRQRPYLCPCGSFHLTSQGCTRTSGAQPTGGLAPQKGVAA
jgi:hypothetical protein